MRRPPQSKQRRAAVASVAGHGRLPRAARARHRAAGALRRVAADHGRARHARAAAAPAPTNSDVTPARQRPRPAPEERPPSGTAAEPCAASRRTLAPPATGAGARARARRRTARRAAAPRAFAELPGRRAAPVPPKSAPRRQPVEPAPAAGPSRSLASHEERAVQRRLSSWTGSFDAGGAIRRSSGATTARTTRPCSSACPRPTRWAWSSCSSSSRRNATVSVSSRSCA